MEEALYFFIIRHSSRYGGDSKGWRISLLLFQAGVYKRVGNQGIFMDSLFHGVADTGGSFFMDSCPGNGVRKRAGSRNDEFSALPASAAIARSRENSSLSAGIFHCIAPRSACMKKTNPAREGNLFRIGGQDKKYFAQQGVDVFRVFTVLKSGYSFAKDIACFLEVDKREECVVPPLRDQLERDKDLCAVKIVHGSAVP